MKFVIRLGKDHKPEVEFFYPDPGPLPPIVDPENLEEAKDGGAPEPPTPADKSQGRVQRLVPGRA